MLLGSLEYKALPHPTGQASPSPTPSVFNVFLPWLCKNPRIYLLFQHLFALRGRPGCEALWGLRKEEAILLDWGVEKTEGPILHFKQKRWRLGPGLPQALSVPLRAPMTLWTLLVLSLGRWHLFWVLKDGLDLHFAGGLHGKDPFSIKSLSPCPPWNFGEVSPLWESGLGRY